ncbi:MarR family transcriptional regulator [Microlunatus endophyticus]|uniref:MarR family transcriptional regulator n=1 Tax=Microlunatus endophyticus TaxID=1716077 RepID=A0A917RZP3_9ACTN|nr:MarR family transcriptional regulator [Microlunatus endophyticus]GGL46829.1 MarR family transcriptional regulator [Microlunatus endophyticus]
MSRPGFVLPLLLLAGFEAITDEANRRLGEQGHPNMRSAYGFAMQAVGRGASVSEVGRTLGISKQAATKTVNRLVDLGYLRIDADPQDARRKIATRTERGMDMLDRSAVIFEQLADEWATTIGRRRLDQLEDDLSSLVGDRALRLEGRAGFGPEGSAD